jgi:hypothetical protein
MSRSSTPLRRSAGWNKVAEMLEKHPDFTIEGYSVLSRFKDPAVAKLIRDNTAKARLPQ